MIFRGTIIKISDNSGARLAKCIGFFESIKCRSVGLNDVIRVCIKKLNRRKFASPKGKARFKVTKRFKLEKGVTEREKLIFRAVILSCSKMFMRRDGTVLQFKNNRVVLLSDSWKFLGTRIIGPITKEVRKLRQISIFKEILAHAKRKI